MMLRTYKAVLTGTHIQWVGEQPQEIDKNHPIDVEITVLDESVLTKAPLRNQRMAKILEKLSKKGVVQDIADPREWQRELRKDRPLPDRPT